VDALMAAPKAPLVDASGKRSKDVTLAEEIFAAEVKSHIVHETVRAEFNARRSGTRGAKSRGMVSGGRSKPWRQKGTGRARQGTIRAPQFTGGGVVFPPTARSFDVKVNKKVRRAALRAALSDHAKNGSLVLIADDAFAEPSTRAAAGLLETLELARPIVLVASDDDAALVKSFRNLERVLVTSAAEVEVAELVWARGVIVSEGSLEALERRASTS
jgi:large subunit ribosomal protein L4